MNRLNRHAKRALVSAVHIEAMERRVLMSAGALDPTFGNGGIVANQPVITPNGQANAIAVQSNGDIVVAGNEVNLINKPQVILLRYQPDGDLDYSFGYHGLVVSPAQSVANAVAIQSNGDIVTAGQSNGYFTVSRYLPNGAVDTSFGSSGSVNVTFGGQNTANAIAISSSGTITVAGYNTGGTGGDFAVMRLTSTGALDSTFGTGGKQLIDFAGKADEASAVELLNGQTYVSGYATTTSGTTEFAVARLNANGSLDTTYGTGGKVVTPFATGNARILTATVEASGTLLAAGYVTLASGIQSSAVAEYTSVGKLSTSFGTGGTTVANLSTPAGQSPANQQLTGIAVRSDGSIAVGGWIKNVNGGFETPQYQWLAGSLSAAGAVTAASPIDFSTYGNATGNLSYAMAMDASGHQVLTGFIQSGDVTAVAVARLNPDLSPDATFGADSGSKILESDPYGVNTSYGAVTGDPLAFTGTATAVAVQASGQIVIGSPTLHRYNADGSLDATFNPPSEPGYLSPSQILIAPGGQIVISESYGSADSIEELNANGTLNTSFGTGGFYNGSRGTIAIGSDGSIFVDGDDETIAKLTPAGKLDTTFGTGGIVQTGLATADGQSSWGIAVLPNGKIDFASNPPAPSSTTPSYNAPGGMVGQLNANGTFDSTFGTNGVYKAATGDQIAALAVDGSQVIFEGTQATPTTYNAYVGRLTSAGKLDGTFGNGGIGTILNTSAVGNNVAVQSDGSILITAYPIRPAYASALARFNPAGQADSTFGTDGLLDLSFGTAYANCFAIAPGNQLYVAGGESANSDPYNSSIPVIARIDLASPSVSLATGTLVGTTGSYGNSGNTEANAFDGNISTYFDAPSATGSYAALDLGSAKVISQISYAGRAGYESRMTGGLFQASNSSSFSTGVVTLYTVPQAPAYGSEATVQLTGTTPYRYVRYVGPVNGYCDIAEAQFYTAATPATTGSISVHLFNDTNAAGVQNPGQDANLSGWGTYLDLNNDGVFDSGDIRLLSDANGNMTFTGLAPGTYVLRQNVPAGYVITAPSTGIPITLSVAAGATTSVTIGEHLLVKLTGTIIGTAGSYHNNGFTIAKAFDGNLSTNFDGPDPSGDWVGLDLGSATLVNYVSFAPRPDLPSRMDGGEIQASSSPTFDYADTITVATITSTPPAGVLTQISLHDYTYDRYYRYIGPANSYCDIAELEFFG